VPLIGVRLALLGFAATVAFGALYVADRQGGWFDLSGHVVLGHAVVELFAWLGLTYIAVGEKLWPMFLPARAPAHRHAPGVAIAAVPGGVAMLSPWHGSRFRVDTGQPLCGTLHPAAEPTGRPYLIRGSSLSATRVTRL
jgi:hypothetical protein